MAVTTQDVQKLYIAYFNRPADYFGLDFQVKAANATSLAAVANGFANSKEFLDTYAGKSDAQFVNALYVNLFGRESDLPGLKFWINLLNTGVVTKGTIAMELLKGAINQDATTVANKVAAAEAFYLAIDTAAEATAYSGDAANAVAKAFLAGITTTESLNAALVPATLDATLTAVVVAGSPTPVDTTFNTTTGIDKFLGTVGNDIVNVGGDTASTLTAGDVLAGGNGVDTLNITAAAGINSNIGVATISGFENVNITGSDFVGINAANAAILAAKTAAIAAKAVTVANLTAASDVAAAVTATAATAATNAATAAQVKAAAIAIGVFTTEAEITTATTAAAPGGAIYTTAQYNAAAIAAQSAAGGATLVTVGDDSVNMTARADALVTAASTANDVAASAKISADAAVTAANTQVGAAALADVTATANLNAATTAAIGITTSATVNAGSFAGVTAIAVDGVATTVTGLTTQSVTLNAGASVFNTLKYSSAATAANVALSSTGGAIILQDSGTSATTGLTTLNLSGSSKQGTAGTHTTAAIGSFSVLDSMNLGAASIKTANIAVTNATAVGTVGMGALTTINAAASTGAVTLNAGGLVSSVTTGSGADNVTISTATSLTVLTQPAAVTVTTGAGNDTITVSTTGTGKTIVSAGDGNDTIVLTNALTTSVSVDGGAGTDTVSVVANGTMGLADYLLIESQVSNVEGIKFTGGSSASIDASSLSQFTSLTFSNASGATVAKVADAQVLNVNSTALHATATSYDASSATNPNGTGALTVNVTGNSYVNVSANSVALNVAAVGSITGTAASSVNVTLEGDVTTATVNLTSAGNWAKAPTADIFATVSIVTDTDFNVLDKLESVKLTGNGHVYLDNSNSNDLGIATSLSLIDASALTSVVKTGALAGTATGTALEFYANANVAETIKLGTGIGQDVIYDSSSTYAKMDTITNFKLVADGIGGFVAAQSDILHAGTGFVAAGAGTTTALAGSTFGAVLTNAGSLGAANVVFQFGGDTYVYSDTGTAGLDAGDVVIKLTGLIDSALLASAIVA